MIKRCAFFVGLTTLCATQAHAERLVSAYDPKLHPRPPTMRSIEGGTTELLLDEEVLEAGARQQAQGRNEALLAAPGDIARVGEVVIVQGDSQILTSVGTGFGIQRNGLQALTQKVIANIGDHFQAITIWMTFEDMSSMMAEAYEVPVRNEVSGLGGLRVMDSSASYGSNGTLRSVLNMKTIGRRAGNTETSWRPHLETWGQESGHRWMMFMTIRDTRTQRDSHALLGRACSHYSKYVDTQASIHDGYAWVDNGDGTFNWTEKSKRYGNLDLYGMGLMAADEVPPFFFIDNIPGYMTPASCQSYVFSFRDPPQGMRGTRVDVTIDDIIAVNGERTVPTDERQDYWREAEVILSAPDQGLDSSIVLDLAARIDKARLFWEAWNLEASQRRLVMCTKISADCGDPRSDVAKVTFNAAGKAPASGPLPLDIDVFNDGPRAATGVKVGFEATVGDAVRMDMKDLGTVEPGATRTQKFTVDLKGVPCGTPIAVKAFSQSDFHYNRRKVDFLLGAQDRFGDDFEEDRGWTVNPDGDDTATGASWERGTPQVTVLAREQVQPGAARGGAGAWVTGLSSEAGQLVREGKVTLQSPFYDTKGLRDPLLRYWVSFAGVRASGNGIEPSELSRLVVQARGVDTGAMAEPTEWIDVDSLSNHIAIDWVQRTSPLPKELLEKSRIQVRFVAIEENGQQGGVEVAIDDVTITSNLPACYVASGTGGAGGTMGPGGGCDCDVAGAGGAGWAGLVVVGMVGLALRRRRPRG